MDAAAGGPIAGPVGEHLPIPYDEKTQKSKLTPAQKRKKMTGEAPNVNLPAKGMGKPLAPKGEGNGLGQEKAPAGKPMASRPKGSSSTPPQVGKPDLSALRYARPKPPSAPPKRAVPKYTPVPKCPAPPAASAPAPPLAPPPAAAPSPAAPPACMLPIFGKLIPAAAPVLAPAPAAVPVPAGLATDRPDKSPELAPVVKRVRSGYPSPKGSVFEALLDKHLADDTVYTPILPYTTPAVEPKDEVAHSKASPASLQASSFPNRSLLLRVLMVPER